MATPQDVEVSSTDIQEESLNCLPCSSEGNNVKAVGFCVNCQEYLCQRCFDVHLIPSITRKHLLLDREKLKDNRNTNISVCSKTCLQHEDKLVEFHCPSHAFFGCYICSFNHQKHCKDVKHIPEISKDIINSKDYKDFKANLTGITTKCCDLLAEIKSRVENLEECHTDAIVAIKDFKDEVLCAIETLERQLTDKANRMKQQASTTMTTAYDKVNKILSEKQKIESTTDFLQNKQHNCDLYTTMVQSKDKLLALNHKILAEENAIGNKKSTLFQFKAKANVLEILESQFDVELRTAAKIHKVEHIADINVKCSSDTKNCWIIGSVLLSNNMIVLTDIDNQQIKLLDISQSKVISKLKVTSRPLGICKITDKKVVTALRQEKKLVLVNTKPSLSVERDIAVNGECRGVMCCEEMLFVCYTSPVKVEMLNMQGKVLKSFGGDAEGQPLFKDPYHLSINPYDKLLYVSDYGNHSLVCLKFDGTFIGKYTDSELSQPWQVICDSKGMVYVCGRGSKNVHQLTADCKKVKILLTSADGLTHPDSICYSERDGRLYIGQLGNNNIKVYKVLYEE